MRKRLLLFVVAAGLSAPALGWAADCTQPAAPKVDWQRCYVDERALNGDTLTGATLRETSFQRASLQRAVLAGVDGYRSRFLSADMRAAVLDGGIFVEADFTKANLAGASLRDADLRRAKFFRANLRGADLTGARLQGADLLNADLSGARWIDGARICAEGSSGQCN